MNFIERNFGYSITHPVFMTSINFVHDTTNDAHNNNNTATGQPRQQLPEERWKTISSQIRNLERIKNHQNQAIQMHTHATWTRHQKTFYRYYEHNCNNYNNIHCNTCTNKPHGHNEIGGKSITAEEYERRYYTHVLHKNHNHHHQQSNPWALYFAALKQYGRQSSAMDQSVSIPQKQPNSLPETSAVPESNCCVNHPALPVANGRDDSHEPTEFTVAAEQEAKSSSTACAIRPEILHEVSLSQENQSLPSTLPISMVVTLPDRDEPSPHPALAAAEERLWKAMDAALAEYSATVLEIHRRQGRMASSRAFLQGPDEGK
jgi:hypothetical protein